MKEKFLECLIGQSDFISGETIAKELGVSRNCIWKYVKELQKQGYNIECVHGKGYRFINSGNNISEFIIKKNIKKSIGIYCYNIVNSTNTLAKDFIREGKFSSESVIIADKQTEGRGRLGKKFYSPSSSGLYMSVILYPEFKATESYLLTAAAAVAVCRAIEKYDDTLSPKIKWVNDIFCGGKKVCGILTEASVDFENGGFEYAIVGIGINLFTREKDFPEDLRNIAGSIFSNQLAENSDFRSLFAADVINKFFDIYDRRDYKFMREYKDRSFLVGKRIVSALGEGIVEEITDRAELILRTDIGKKVTISAGEISVKEIK